MYTDMQKREKTILLYATFSDCSLINFVLINKAMTVSSSSLLIINESLFNGINNYMWH